MSLESDLLFAQQALQLGFIEEAAVTEALRACGGQGLAEELVRRKLLTADEVAAVRAVAEAILKRKAANPALRERPPVAVAVPAKSAPPPGPDPGAEGSRGGNRAAGVVGTVALGRDRPVTLGTVYGRLTASGASRADASREGQIVISLGPDSSDLFDRIVAGGKLQASLQDVDLAAIPEGALPKGTPGGRKLFLSRKVTQGRSLEEAIEEDTKLGPLQAVMDESRFLRAFRDACVAVAYAHGLGLVHRRLSSRSIQFGERGEVIVADWALAQFPGAPPGKQPSQIVDPTCVAPEISGGGTADARSDVYALGAILYRVMARRAPYSGNSAEAVLEQQRAGMPTTPSKLGMTISRELESSCMKALAAPPELRQPDAAALLLEIETALAGGSSAKQAADAAAAHVDLADKSFEAYKAAQAEARFQHLESRSSEVRWGAASDLAREAVHEAHIAEKEAVEALREAEKNIAAALELVKNHREARRLKAEIHWAEFQHAEETGDEKAGLLHLQMVSRFNDGEFDVQLRGEGTLSVSTESYRCPCLRSGRMVTASEAVHLGYHVASGRALDGEIAAEGLRTLEWARPASIQVHGKECLKHAVQGADVWIFRLLTQGPLKVPAASGRGYPTDPEGVPMSVFRALFEQDSPFLASAGGQRLGKTPIRKLALPFGSYLLVVNHEGSRPVRVPVWVGRCESVDLKVTLYAPDEIPPGFVQISQGKFGWQGDRENPQSLPHEALSLPDIFMGREPVTCREYAEYLNDLAKSHPREAESRAPRRAPAGPAMWPGSPWGPPADGGPGGKWQLPGCTATWEPSWPVLGVSWEDALHYGAWLRGRKPWMIAIPHEMDWEKAARGPDRRRFPWGNGFEPTLCNSEHSLRDGPRPVTVRSFPMDESPYGVRGMAGNSRDFCLNSPGADFPEARILRGGYWNASGAQLAASYRSTAATRHVSPKGGFRLAMMPSL
ncbi:MAG: SUMF1/EgtB/PvdO family nonheme iron enzyme [Planctomycetes bacterium]|nr:SUMF1/EgtB/PvdO family nonheme iron enzyme [Planctomycetota bacterium]